MKDSKEVSNKAFEEHVKDISKKKIAEKIFRAHAERFSSEVPIKFP